MREKERESMGGTQLESTLNPNARCQSIRMPIFWQNNAIILYVYNEIQQLEIISASCSVYIVNSKTCTKTGEDFKKPNFIVVYNRFMKCMDTADQCISNKAYFEF
jgi:hypothetical protein